MIICHKVVHEDYNELIFEYKEIGENMKVYHVETKEAYDELMIELENKGYTWNSDAKPKNYNGFKWYEESTLIITRDKELKIVFDSISLYVCNEGENIIEYKAKGENMKVYHVETQGDYDTLMIELEEKGCEWRDGEKLTDVDEFSTHGKDTYVYEERCEISISSGDYFKKYHSDMPVIEYKAKGENMKLYQTKTQVDYDALMIELEEKGFKWLSGDKPTCFNYWKQEEENSCVEISGKDITFGSIEWHKKEYPDTPIIEYKAKVEADLQEAKLSAKKLIEKIGEFLESRKPEFKVGDYATVEVSGRKIIAKIDELTENKTAFGLWYDKTRVNVKQDFWFLTEGNIFSHSTPEEIAEYEVALTFHKYGRKPFEVKEGDLIEYPNGHNNMIYYPEIFSKADFLNDGFKLIKTAEEVNEWLENK